MLRLRTISTTTIPIEAEAITPGRLVNLTPAEIATLPVQYGNAPAPLGDFFTVEGDSSDQDIAIEGDCTRVKMLGARMKSGSLTIRGNAGMHTGAEMTGGALHVHGHVGDWAGAEMRDGLIHIHGNAGNLVGAAYRGSRHGMRGGVILVDGNAGSEIGHVMRRGLIAIGGDTGDFPAASLIAGSVFVFGQAGARPGAGMKRGTLALLGPPTPLLPTFRFDCVYRPVFLILYLRDLQRLGFMPAKAWREVAVQRYSGDLVALGKGEILTTGVY